MNKLAITCAACLVAVPAMAQLPDQNVIRKEAYSPDVMTTITMEKGKVTDIVVSETETVKRVVLYSTDGPVTALPAADANQTAMLNNIPLFGHSVGSTDLVLITSDKANEERERAYLLNIKVVEAPSDGSIVPGVTLKLVYTYEVQQKAAQVQIAQVSWQQKKEDQKLEQARARLNVDVFYGPQHWAYMTHGKDVDLAPVEAHDNTRITALRYPANMAHPAIFKVLDGVQGKPSVCQGKRPTKEELRAPEQAVNTVVRDDMIVIQETAPHWRLRSGTEVMDLYGCEYDPIGYNPGTGTLSPDVWRKVIKPAPSPAAKVASQ